MMTDLAPAAPLAAVGASAARGALPVATVAPPAIVVRDLTAAYGRIVALRGISLTCAPGSVTAIIGPSGCGKSTLLRCLNRLHETTVGASVNGQVHIGDEEIHDHRINPIALRRRVGMMFQRPAPFPTLSIFENVAAGVRAAGRPRHAVRELVERSLQRAGLWAEVRDRLQSSALALSGGQQQRLCIARALAVDPHVLLLDEPTTSLDPVGTQRIEELLYDLRGSMTVVLVTHNMQQAARVADSTVFLLEGTLVEQAPSRLLFTTPSDPRTEAYITGRFG